MKVSAARAREVAELEVDSDSDRPDSEGASSRAGMEEGHLLSASELRHDEKVVK